jgi:glycosyltransferase involved in cell wall biosynthesis
VFQMSRAQVAYAWSRSLVGVVPSLWSEPFGTVAAEALSFGVPVVASDVGGLAEIIRDGVDGRIVPPGSAGSLRDAISMICSNSSLRAAMSAHASQRAQRFRMANLTPLIELVYAEVASKRSGRPV